MLILIRRRLVAHSLWIQFFECRGNAQQEHALRIHVLVGVAIFLFDGIIRASTHAKNMLSRDGNSVEVFGLRSLSPQSRTKIVSRTKIFRHLTRWVGGLKDE